MNAPATYLGDGAYARFDGFSVWIYTSDGINTTNEVCLEPEVLARLLEYVAELKR